MLRGSFSHGRSAQFQGGLEAAPHALRLVFGLDVGEQARMLEELVLARPHDQELRPFTLEHGRPRRSARAIELDRKAVLPASHCQVDLGEERRIEQRAVEAAVSVIDLVALAQRVEGVFLSRMQLARKLQRIDDARAVRFDRRQPEPSQLQIEEFEVEGGVVDHQLRALNVVEKFRSDLAKSGFVLEELVGDAVHLERTHLAFALGVDVAMEVVPGDAPAQDLDTAQFDDPVAQACVEAGGFGVQDDSSHRRSNLSPPQPPALPGESSVPPEIKQKIPRFLPLPPRPGPPPCAETPPPPPPPQRTPFPSTT